jgi:hypothetical protein
MARKHVNVAGMAAAGLASLFGTAQAAAPTPPPEENLFALIKPNADGSLPQRGG